MLCLTGVTLVGSMNIDQRERSFDILLRLSLNEERLGKILREHLRGFRECS
jgi:hypothetical protein